MPLTLNDKNESRRNSRTENREVYNSSDLLSKPFLSNDCQLPENIIELHHSFGYDCRLHFNLEVADENTLLFISGNLIHIFNVQTREMKFRRSAGGGGLGHISSNKNEKYSDHIAVAEKGVSPLIIIYRWPHWDVISVLKGGALREYTCLDFNPDGTLLASQGGSPDYLLTIWDWKNSSIILSVKSHDDPVFNVKFSHYVPGELVTSGAGHVKFWKMLRTFSGLKIIGKLGRFGKTETSDIIGVYPMPNNYTLTGCSWGNMLLWEDDVIKLEITRKGRKPCHSGPIVQFRYYHESRELTSISIGDFIKVWNFTAVESFYPAEDEKFMEMKPIYEIQIKDKFSVAHFYSMAKRSGKENRKIQNWFGQDLNGGIWDVDISISRNVKDPKKLYWCHAKSVSDIAASPHGYYLASLGEDGRLYIYDVQAKKVIIIKHFPTPGYCLNWLPLHVAKSGSIIVAGFGDGSLKVLIANIQKQIICEEDNNFDWITVIQMSKPHLSTVSKIALNSSGTLLVSGSRDSTIFIFEVLRDEHVDVTLQPVGFVAIPEPVTSLSVNPMQDNVILVGCERQRLLEVELPKKTQECDTQESYKLECYIEDLTANFPTAETNRKDEKFKVVNASYKRSGTIWFCLEKSDPCCIFEFKKDTTESFNTILIPDTKAASLSCFQLLNSEELLFFAFNNGKIRVTETDVDQSDFSKFWELSMHDNFNGLIPKLCLSHDQRFLFSCGSDGNIFAYTLNCCSEYFTEYKPLPSTYIEPLFTAIDEYEDLIYSLEERKQNLKQDKILEAINKRKADTRKTLANLKLQYEDLLKRNSKLSDSHQLPRPVLELDERITNYIQLKIQNEMNLLNEKMAYDIERSQLGLKKVRDYFIDPVQHFLITISALRIDQTIMTFSLRKLGSDFEKLYQEVKIQRGEEIHVQMERDFRMDQMIMRKQASFKFEQMDVDLQPKLVAVESFLKDVEQLLVKLPLKTRRLLDRYQRKKSERESREKKWHKLLRDKPDGSSLDPKDVALLEEAGKKIGDYKLKTAKDYEVPRQFCKTVLQQFLMVLECKLEIFRLKNDFNTSVLALRREKLQCITALWKYHKKLTKLNEELPPEYEKILSPVPEINVSLEYPDRDFQEDPQELFSPDPESYVVSSSSDEEFVAEESITGQGPASKDKTPLVWQDHISSKLPKNYADVMNDEFYPNLDPKNETLVRLLKKQATLMKKSEQVISKFDGKLESLAEERVKLSVDIIFKELYLLTLNQELIIIKKYENRENEGLADVVRKLEEKSKEQDLIEELCLRIEDKLQELKSMQDDGLRMTKTFYETIEDAKHAKYLKRIFSKKHASRKASSEGGILRDSLLSSSSGSSESELEFDFPASSSRSLSCYSTGKNCPASCELELYQLAHSSHLKRREIKHSMKKKKEEIDSMKIKLESLENKVRLIENELQLNENKLKDVRREKQKELNQVETVVVLNLDQLCHFRSSAELEDLANTVLFPRTEWERLHSRLNELKDETENINVEGRRKQTHLHRLNLDCKKMKEEIAELTAKISETIITKFGQAVDVDSLEEIVLRRLLGEIRSTLPEVEEEMWKEKELKLDNLRRKEELLTALTKKNTEKAELLTTLEEEYGKLKHTIDKQEYLKNTKSVKIGDEWRDDINKLMKIRNHLNLKQEILQNEIRSLSFKGRPLPPIVSPPPPKIEDSDDGLSKAIPSSLPCIDRTLKKQSKKVLLPTNMEDNLQEWLLDKIEAIIALLDSPSSFKDLVIKQLIDDLASAIESSSVKEDFVLLSKETLETILEMIQVEIAPQTPSRASMEKLIKETLQSLYRSKIAVVKKVPLGSEELKYEEELDRTSAAIVESTLKSVLERMRRNSAPPSLDSTS
nr:PREDICTED: uncharacterized protein LOC109031139 [Bemisia tabaci]